MNITGVFVLLFVICFLNSSTFAGLLGGKSDKKESSESKSGEEEKSEGEEKSGGEGNPEFEKNKGNCNEATDDTLDSFRDMIESLEPFEVEEDADPCKKMEFRGVHTLYRAGDVTKYEDEGLDRVIFSLGVKQITMNGFTCDLGATQDIDCNITDAAVCVDVSMDLFDAEKTKVHSAKLCQEGKWNLKTKGGGLIGAVSSVTISLIQKAIEKMVVNKLQKDLPTMMKDNSDTLNGLFSMC